MMEYSCLPASELRELLLKGELKHKCLTEEDYRAILDNETLYVNPDTKVLEFCVKGLSRFEKYKIEPIPEFKYPNKQNKKHNKRILKITAAVISALLSIQFALSVFGINIFKYIFIWNNEETVIADNIENTEDYLEDFIVEYDSLTEMDTKYRELCSKYLSDTLYFQWAIIKCIDGNLTITFSFLDDKQNVINLYVYNYDALYIEKDDDGLLEQQTVNGVTVSYFSNMQDYQAVWEWQGYLYQLSTQMMTLDEIKYMTANIIKQ